MRNPLTADEPVAGYESNVFINCPFDKEYYALLRPLLFTIIYTISRGHYLIFLVWISRATRTSRMRLCERFEIGL